MSISSTSSTPGPVPSLTLRRDTAAPPPSLTEAEQTKLNALAQDPDRETSLGSLKPPKETLPQYLEADFDANSLPEGFPTPPGGFPVGAGASQSEELEDLGATPDTGARIGVNTEGSAGTFLCSHVTRINAEFRTQDPALVSGFIHIPENPTTEQLSEVVGMGIRGVVEEQNAPETTVMLTGFTQFANITDNATSRFLFGDGTRTDADSFGFRPETQAAGQPARQNLDAMMERQFGLPASVTPFERDNQPVGLSYTYTNPPRTVNLALTRLPVDEYVNDESTGENNLAGDGTGNTLRQAYASVRPDAIISLGVDGGLPDDQYALEVNGSAFTGFRGKGVPPDSAHNDSLANVFRRRMPAQTRPPTGLD
ncbi:MAG: hypothetical protein ACO1RX_06685 [Candidatus Sericytochromatia bacterium]